MKHLDLKKGIFLITYGILLTMFIVKWDFFAGVFSTVYGLLAPFIYGLVLAFLVNGPYELFHKKVFRRLAQGKEGKRAKAARGLSVAAAYLLVFLCIAAMVWVVIPQVAVSLSQLSQNIGGYWETAEQAINNFGGSVGLHTSLREQLDALWGQLGSKLTDIVGQVAPKVIDFTVSFTTGVINWVIGLVVSVYMLYSKETLIHQLKKLILAVFPQKVSAKVLEVGTVSNRIFVRYLLGRIYDSLIVLVLCFVGMSILQMPYAVLISVIVGITNIIPVFGPFLGGIPSAIILLMVDPMKGFGFIVFIIALQQIDGNVICPLVVGDSLGISGIWVLAGVAIGGGLWGVPGMVIGVPVLAVFYLLLKDFVNKRLKKKGIQLEPEGPGPEKEEAAVGRAHEPPVSPAKVDDNIEEKTAESEGKEAAGEDGGAECKP